MTIDEFSKHLIERSVASLSEKYGEKCPKCGKSPCECDKEEVKEAKNKEGKEQGADGKACWKGYKYAGTEKGKDKCVKMEEVEKKESEKDEGGKHKEYKHAAGKEEKGEKKTEKEMKEAKDLPGNQEKIDANKNGKIDAHDFHLLRNKRAKKSVKEMWEKAAEVQEGYGKAKKKVAEGKKVEIEIMPNVDTPNDPEPPSGRKTTDDIKKKLKKEEVEPLEEKKLSKAETAKKEKFVKGMKKKFGSFKSKYGERAKEVMYATATKMGKKAA